MLFKSATFVTTCSKDDDKPSTPATPVTEKSKIINKYFLITDYNLIVNGQSYITYADIETYSKDDIPSLRLTAVVSTMREILNVIQGIYKNRLLHGHWSQMIPN